MPGVTELLQDSGIEVVVVASPTDSHFEIARTALEAGRHVVIDKPMAVTVAEADTLIALAAAHGRVLTVFQNRRWDGDYLTVRRAITEGWLGKVYEYDVHYDRFRPNLRQVWREQPLPGSGVFYDLGVHLIDQTLQLFGMPEAVTADIFAQREGAQAVDYFHLILEYGRARALLHGSVLVPGPGPRFQVHGDAGSFIEYGVDPQEDQLKAGLRPGDPQWGMDARTFGELISADGSRRKIPTLRGRYEEFYRELVACIRDGGPPPVDPASARDTLKVVEAALYSAAEGRKTLVR